ncbi:MAG: hypothetical protein AAF517_17920, partial [Planctomycetota bacterium]
MRRAAFFRWKSESGSVSASGSGTKTKTKTKTKTMTSPQRHGADSRSLRVDAFVDGFCLYAFL